MCVSMTLKSQILTAYDHYKENGLLMTQTPIYDQLVWEQNLMGIVGRPDDPVPTYRVGDLMYLGRPPLYNPGLADSMLAAREKMKAAFRLMTASGGSSSQEVSASSASRHSLPDSSRPESSTEEMPITGWVRRGGSYRVGDGVKIRLDEDVVWVNGRRYYRVELEDMSSEEMRALFETGEDPRPLDKQAEYVDWDAMAERRNP